MLTVSILKVGDFETLIFHLNKKYYTSQKPLIYNYFADFLYTFLLTGFIPLVVSICQLRFGFQGLIPTIFCN